MKLFKAIFKFTVVIIFLLISIGVYAFKVEPYLLVTKKHHIGKESSKEKLTIVQLSDIELSHNYTEKELPAIIEKVNSLKPDLVVFTGDLFANYAKYRPTEDAISFLGKIEAKYGKYAIWGNNDYGGGAVRHYKQIMEQGGFQVLQNESVTLSLSDNQKIFLGGLDDAQLGNPDINLIVQNMNEEFIYSILLAHEPDMVELVEEYPFDLILAGHSHGGQVNVEFLRKYFGIDTKYRGGFYDLDTGGALYVHSGMGTSRIPVRFLVPPQITYFQIGI